MATRRDFIRSKVEELLSKATITDPPVDVVAIAKVLGLDIRYQPPPETDDQVSGCLIRKGSRAVIGVNESQHPNRQRFTIAHEIGHSELHRGEKLYLDRVQTFRVNFRDSVSSAAVDPEEMEANFFAAELLMPARFLVRELDRDFIDLAAENDDALTALAKKYGVSVQALTYRLINLGLMPANS